MSIDTPLQRRAAGGRPGSWDRAASVPMALGMAAVGLALSFGLKYQCLAHGWSDNYQYTHLCYNEIQALFGVRGIQAGLLPYRDTAFEYPVVTGMFMDLAGRVLRGLVRLGIVARNSDSGYFLVSAAMLAPFSLGTTLFLRPRVTAARLALWAVGLPTLLYTFHNWDVLAVFGAAWGLAEYEKGRYAAAGSGMAMGASAKLFPAFLAPGAVLARWAERDSKGAGRLIAGFLAAYALFNVPWIVVASGPPRGSAGRFPDVMLREAGTNGWLDVWLFHADRFPDYWTLWYWLGAHFPGLQDSPPVGGSFSGFVSLASFALFGLATVYLLRRGWVRRTEPGGYPVVAVGLGVVVAFLISSKVYSPQYALWSVPMIAMLNIRYRYVFAYFVAELAVLVSGFWWFTVFDEPNPGWKQVLEVAVWCRAAVLLVLFWQAAGALRLLPAGDAGEPAEESATIP